MSAYIRKKYCPYCKFICCYEKRYTARRYMADYGSPIRQCSGCKQYFIDRDYREIAVQGIRGVDTLPITYSKMILAGFWALAALFCLFETGFMGLFFLAD